MENERDQDVFVFKTKCAACEWQRLSWPKLNAPLSNCSLTRHATCFITLSDLVGFANLLIGVFRFISTRHRPKHPFINERS